MEISEIKNIMITTVIPLVSMVVGILPLVWSYSNLKKRSGVGIGISIGLSLVTYFLFSGNIKLDVFNIVLVVSLFLLYFLILSKNRISYFLYRNGWHIVRKPKVGIMIPSNAMFNELMINSLIENHNHRFKFIDIFEQRGRKSALEKNYSDTNYHLDIDKLSSKNCKFMVMHAKSGLLSDEPMLNSLRRFLNKGGVVINLISILDHGLLKDISGEVYSIRLNYSKGLQHLNGHLKPLISSRDKIYLIVGPQTSDSSNSRFIQLTSWLGINNLKFDFIRLARWSSQEARRAMKDLDLDLGSRRIWLYCWNDEIAIGVDEYLKERETSLNARIISFDGIPEVLARIESSDSYIFGTVYHKMNEIGDLSGDVISNILKGYSQDSVVQVDCSSGDIVLADN